MAQSNKSLISFIALISILSILVSTIIGVNIKPTFNINIQSKPNIEVSTKLETPTPNPTHNSTPNPTPNPTPTPNYFAIPFSFLIFQIGFHKCGTLSIQKFFQLNHIPCKHHFLVYRIAKKNKSLFDIYLKNKPKRAFFDFGIAAVPHPNDNELYDCIKDKTLKDRSINCKYVFPILDKHYKNSKFILNVRSFNHWIKSEFFCAYCQKRYGLVLYKEGFSLHDIVIRLKTVWYRYLCDVVIYFKDRPNDLLIYDIDRENEEKIIDFFHPLLNLTNVYRNNTVTHEATRWKGKYTSEWNTTQELWENIVVNQYVSTVDDGIAEIQKLTDLCFNESKLNIHLRQ